MATNPKAGNTVTATVDITTTVKSVRGIYTLNENGIRILNAFRFDFDDSFDAIVKQGEEYVDGKADYVSLRPGQAIAMLINGNSNFAPVLNRISDKSGGRIAPSDLEVLLQGAKVTMARTRFEEGDTYISGDGEEMVHANAGYNTEFTNIVLVDEVAQMIANSVKKRLASLLD